MIHNKWPDKPIVVSEFGAGAIKGLSGDKLYTAGFGAKRDYTEAYQAYLCKVQLAHILNKKDFVVGTAPWILADFRDISKPYRPLADLDVKGLLTYDRQKKMAYNTVASAYKQIQKDYEQ